MCNRHPNIEMMEGRKKGVWKSFSHVFFFFLLHFGDINYKLNWGTRRSQDGGGIGRGDHFLFYKFIERTTERWTKFTKQLLNASSGHRAPRKAAHCLRREGKKNCFSFFFFFLLFFLFFFFFSFLLLFSFFSFLSFLFLAFLSYFLLKSPNTPLLFLNFHFHLNITLQNKRKKKEEREKPYF